MAGLGLAGNGVFRAFFGARAATDAIVRYLVRHGIVGSVLRGLPRCVCMYRKRIGGLCLLKKSKKSISGFHPRQWIRDPRGRIFAREMCQF